MSHPLTWPVGETPDRFIHVDVDYPHPHTVLALPDEHVGYAVRLFRADLELARSLELEVSGYDRVYLETTRAADGGPELEEDSYGLTGPVVRFQRLMTRLAAIDAVVAKAEVAAWPVDDYIFARLRIWAAGSTFLEGGEAGELLLSLSIPAFWGSTHTRDLLLALQGGSIPS